MAKKKFADLAKACWKGYKAVGLKDKDGKKVPNCVPESVQLSEEKHEIGIDHRYSKDKNKHDHVIKTLAKHDIKATDAGDKETYFHVHKDKVEQVKKELKAGGVHPTHWINGEWKEETETIQEADEIQSSDYKLSKSGKKIRAKHIIFHNQDDDKEDDKEKDMKEELKPSMGAGAYIDDFQKSDAPQFKGKSKEKRRIMGIAAYMAAKKDMKEQAPVAPVPDKKYIKGTPEHKAYKATKKPINGMPTNCKEETSVDEAIETQHEYHLRQAAYHEKQGNTERVKYHKDRAAEEKRSHDWTRRAEAEYMRREEVELNEANHREFAAKGKMHPDMAKHMEAGREMDFYAHGTGDKVSGKVIKNDGKSVHVKVTHNPYKEKDSSVHKFSVTDKLDEGYDSPLDTPAAKKARETLKKALLDIKKKNPNHPAVADVKEEVRKSDIPAYLRKQKGEKPLTVADVKAPRKDSISDKENLAKARNEELKGNQHKLDKNKNGKLDKKDFELLRKEDFENGDLETNVKSYKDFIQSLNEYNSADGVYRHKGNYGGSHQDSDEDDEDDKPKSKPASTEKRGRGRPKGSASGARQKGSGVAKKTNGADYTGYKLHLPNTNK